MKPVIDEKEIQFIRSMIHDIGVCAPIYDGWYFRLCNGVNFEGYSLWDLERKDYIVADYHTTPADCGGNIMGWVSHAGPGAVDMAIITAKDATGQLIAYVGPVSSYHTYVTTNFLRLTDSEWKETYLETSSRPDWVNTYLADKSGETRGSGASLVVGIDNNPNAPSVIPSTTIFAKNYPNPFNATTIINFVIPAGLTDYFTKLTIYTIQGKVIKKLIESKLPPGNYLTRWDATDKFNRRVASGTYIYELKVGGIKYSGKMNLVK